MDTRALRTSLSVLVTLVCCAPAAVAAENTQVDFESDQWVSQNGQVTDYLGRKCFVGFGSLADVEFGNGVVEVDLAVPSADVRSYPGVYFRMQGGRNNERIYVRPHRAPIYPDAIQYTPTINGIAGWQLYSGDGFTALAEIPEDEWIHLRLEVSGAQARLYMGNGERPALEITGLVHGVSSGAIALESPPDGTAYFSNLSYRINDGLVFPPPPTPDAMPGAIRSYEISQAFPLSEIEIGVPPERQDVGAIEWRKIEAAPSGLVDVALHTGRLGRAPDCVMARTTLHAGGRDTLRLDLGYSDAVNVFLNGRPLFLGLSAYTQRDPSFLGIIGYFDVLYLPLGPGENELSLIVAESFGGWGFMCRDGEAMFTADGVSEEFEVEGLLTPESVLYDSERDVFYVSNYDAYGRAGAEGQFLTRLTSAGEIDELRWVTGLRMPTGMVMSGDHLFVVERGGVAEIDPEVGEIVARHEIPRARFPNDIAVDDEGRVYVSDSAGSTILRFSDGAFEPWVTGGEIQDPNGLLVDGGELLVVSNGDRRLKAIDLETREVRVIATFASGTLDGLRSDGAGNYLVSHWQGRLYRVSPSGETEKLLDTSVPGVYLADFEFVPDDGRVVVPTFNGDKVVGYRIE